MEFQTTMKYIHDYLKPGMRVLEIAAGTGRYSRALADEGFEVDALELVGHNIEIFHRKMKPENPVRLIQGNAMDLSAFRRFSLDGQWKRCICPDADG